LAFFHPLLSNLWFKVSELKTRFTPNTSKNYTKEFDNSLLSAITLSGCAAVRPERTEIEGFSS
jgi:hypothetical protein